MTRFYVPLDVNYQFDDKIMSAGHLAECVYVRGLAYAKRAATEGKLHRSQLPMLTLGLPGKPDVHAATLEVVGLWESTDEGWYITGWLNHNLSNGALAEQKAKIKAKSIAGNHKQHHTLKGIVDPDCELCNPPNSPPTGDKELSLQGAPPGPLQGPNRRRTEYEYEDEQKTNRTENESSSSSVKLELVATTPPDDDGGMFLESIVQFIASERMQGRSCDSPARYRATVVDDLRKHHRHALELMLTNCPWLDTPTAAAAHYQARPELHPQEIA